MRPSSIRTSATRGGEPVPSSTCALTISVACDCAPSVEQARTVATIHRAKGMWRRCAQSARGARRHDGSGALFFSLPELTPARGAMSPETRNRVGIGVLSLGVLILLVNLAGMSGMIAKVAPSRDLNLVTLVLVFGGSAIRRRARKPLD